MTRLKYEREERRALKYMRLFASLQREHQRKQSRCKVEPTKTDLNQPITYEWLIEHTVLIKTCSSCGKEFYTKDKERKYCDKQCRKKYYNKLIREQRQNLINQQEHDADITLLKLYEQDKGICYLCGKPCNLNDYRIINGTRIGNKTYPSIDHIIPLNKGGTHTWDNIKLAHTYCNQKKADHEYPNLPPH